MTTELTFLKEEHGSIEDSMCFLVQLLGFVLLAVSFISFSVSNDNLAFLRILETSEKAY